MEAFGWAATVLVGVVLGLLGAGGAILLVPILVYLFHKPASIATGYSLFVVGITSGVGCATYLKRGEIRVSAGISFALLSFPVVFLTRRFVVPSIPAQIARFGSFELTRDKLLLLIFAVLMIAISTTMVRSREGGDPPADAPQWLIPLVSVLVGFVAGLVGTGGGFLIIPALVLIAGIPMKAAVGTSLFIISVQSLLGFTGELGTRAIDWSLLLEITALAVLGILVGSLLSKRISGSKLRPAFGFFVLAMGLFIAIRELLF